MNRTERGGEGERDRETEIVKEIKRERGWECWDVADHKM